MLINNQFGGVSKVFGRNKVRFICTIASILRLFCLFVYFEIYYYYTELCLYKIQTQRSVYMTGICATIFVEMQSRIT